MQLTPKDIRITTTYYDNGLEIIYINRKREGAGGLLRFSPTSLACALYTLGYITDYDKELVCVPMPVNVLSPAQSLWMPLCEFVAHNLDDRLAARLIIDHRCSEPIKQRTKWQQFFSLFR